MSQTVMQLAADDAPLWQAPAVIGATITATVGVLGVLAAGEFLTAKGRLRRRLDKQLDILGHVDPLGDHAKQHLVRQAQLDAWHLIWLSESRYRVLTNWLIGLSVFSLAAVIYAVIELRSQFSTDYWNADLSVLDRISPFTVILISTGAIVWLWAWDHKKLREARRKYVRRRVDPWAKAPTSESNPPDDDNVQSAG